MNYFRRFRKENAFRRRVRNNSLTTVLFTRNSRSAPVASNPQRAQAIRRTSFPFFSILKRSDRHCGQITVTDSSCTKGVLDGVEIIRQNYFITRIKSCVTREINGQFPVKPTGLTRWLSRLVTPPSGLILDRGKGAVLEAFRFVGIEIEEDSLRIAESRIRRAFLSCGNK